MRNFLYLPKIKKKASQRSVKKPEKLISFCFFSFVLIAVAFLTACGGGGNNSGRSSDSPAITSFEASATTVVEGDSVTLTAIFNNGSGSIDNGVGAVTSGDPKTISPTATTTFLLKVTSNEGVEVTSTVTVTVKPRPSITSFETSATTIVEGDSVTLTAILNNGSGSIDNGVGAVTSGDPKTVSPTATTTFSLTVTNSEGVEIISTVTVTVEPHPITLKIFSPDDNHIVNSDSELKISATIQSIIDIATITASVSDQSVPLIYSASAICARAQCTGGFIGQLSVDELAPGSYVLNVTAVDVEGKSISKQRTIKLDNKPILTVTEPLELTVASPNLPVSASCSDDLGDCEINVSVHGGLLASAVNTLSATIDLSGYDGLPITLNIEGKDSSNQHSLESRAILVEASANLETVKNFTGRVIDFDGQQALLLVSGDDGESLSIQNVTSDVTTVVEVPSGLTVSPSHSVLTPTGAIYLARAMDGTQRIYDWNNSTLHELGRPNSTSSLTVAGDYAIWSEGNTLWLRQFSTNTNFRVSTSAGNSYNAVGKNGVVAYWTVTDYAIRKNEAGIETTLAVGSELWNAYVISDGTRFVYGKDDSCCTDKPYAIAHHDGTNETILTNFTERRAIPGRDYRINSGWVAFTVLGGLGQNQVWTRDPSGTLLQRTVFGSDSSIGGLSADGEVMVINSNKRYLSRTTGELTEVSSALGSSTKINGIWYISVGRSLLKMR